MARTTTPPRATLQASSAAGEHEWLVLWPSTKKACIAITNGHDEVQRLVTRVKRLPLSERETGRRRGPAQTAIWRATERRAA